MFSKEVYINRRKRLKESVSSGLIVLLGNSNSSMNFPDNCYPFRQDSSFLYYAGLDTPDLCLVIDVKENKEYLFGHELTMDDIIWMGDLPSLKERAASVGIDTVQPFYKLSDLVLKSISKGREIHYLKPYRYKNQILLSDLFGEPLNQVVNGFSETLTKAVISMRMVKDEVELEDLWRAGKIGYEMHYTAMRMCKSGMSEQLIAGTIDGISRSYGKGVSFPTILSQNGQIMHSHDHSGILKEGKLMLTDAGAESNNHYASDFTRTVAVGGKFTQKQKEIYDIVLEVNNQTRELVKPGVTYRSVHDKAYRTIFDRLKDLGLTRGDTEDALSKGAPALFMPHGLGHALGLDVHDMENLGETYVGYDDEVQRSEIFGYSSLRLGRRLQKNFVLTDEPGIYFIPQLIEKWKSEGINKEFINFEKLEDYYDFGGIRIEDDLVVTDEGCRLVYDEKRLPATTDEIYEAVNS